MKKIFAGTVFSLMIILAVSSQSRPTGFYQVLKKASRESVAKYWRDEIKIYKVKNGMRLLDVGGGDGKLILPLALVCDSLDYYLEDINPDYLFYAPKFMALAQKKMNPHANFNIYQIIGGDSTVPAISSSFDRIIVRETFHHFEYPMQMLIELKRLLAPDGMLIISEPAYQKNFKFCKLIEPQKLIEMVKSSGFKFVSSEKTNTDFIVYIFTM